VNEKNTKQSEFRRNPQLCRMKLSIGFSPCPNDTFIFFALLHQKINTHGFEFSSVMEDVETLNKNALAGKLDISKLSFAMYPKVHFLYRLLNSGSALGNHCGPLLISERNFTKEEIPSATVAIPGENTTAHFLFNRFFPDVKEKREMIFSEIEDALLKKETDLGVIIHENRFTYEKKGLKKVADLGELWEEQTGLPIPLGGIFIRKDFPEEVITAIDEMISESVQYAFSHPEEAIEYVKKYSQEMEEKVMWQHIHLYVNDYTVSLGERGHAAIQKFLSIADPITPLPQL
jgi:1,4-dihydroxy-6-naphthoate synthase